MLETLRISVISSAETGDHEVLLQSEHGDLIGRFGDGAMGLDPADILVVPSPLLPGDGPHSATIGRCSCGYVGCGSSEVTIATDGEVVTWTNDLRPIGARFEAAQYTAEVERALADSSWETPDRTAARLIKRDVDREHLRRSGLVLDGAWGRIELHEMSVSLRYLDGRYQIVAPVPWHGESPQEIADACCRLLATEPRTWRDVRWFPQRDGLRRPDNAGWGWRLDPH